MLLVGRADLGNLVCTNINGKWIGDLMRQRGDNIG